ncbi:MAG TPA: competence/damage-inducible protein A [Candidatus Polarisedimenticolaceae bacterium]
MKAAIVAVGTELLGPGRPDTNAVWLAERLERLGAEVRIRVLVADDEGAIAAALVALASECDVVVATGGLGPTEDDRTREALARAAGVPLERDDARLAALRAAYASRGRTLGPEQERQADRPRGARFIDNPVGSAPGLFVSVGAALVAALPGVPAEMTAMFEGSVAREVASRGAGTIVRRVLRVGGRTESSVDVQLRDLYGADGVEVTILAASGAIDLILRARGPDASAARARLAPVEAEMRRRLGADLFGEDDATLASVVGGTLAGLGRTVATAESCTGGLLGAELTTVPGSSAWYRGGVVAYANEVKVGMVGVDATVLDEHGAVSEAVARAMAAGIRERLGADYGVAVTGVAGPSGGTPEKPVGLVHHAVADAGGGAHVVLRWPGDRALIRRRSVLAALDLLRRRMREA